MGGNQSSDAQDITSNNENLSEHEKQAAGSEEISKLLDDISDPKSQNLLSEFALTDPVAVYDNTLSHIMRSEDEQNQVKYSIILMGIIHENVNPVLRVQWMRSDYHSRVEKMKKRLYTYAKFLKTENKALLQNVGISIGKIALIEYPHDGWQNDFNMLLEQLPNSENSSDSLYCFISILQYLLQHNIPTPNDVCYDYKVTTILTVINTILESENDIKNSENKENESKDNSGFIIVGLDMDLKRLCLECLENAIRMFEKHFSNFQICQKQIYVILLNLAKKNELIPLCYRCLCRLTYLHYNFVAEQIQDIFAITIKHLKDEKNREFAVKFWSVVSKIEGKIDQRYSHRFTLGIIPFIVDEKYLLKFITITDPEDFDPDSLDDDSISSKSEKCLINFLKAEPDPMFKILASFYVDHNQDVKANNKRAALVAFRCLLHCRTEGDAFFVDNLQNIMDFARNVNEKLKFVAVNILHLMFKFHPQIISSQKGDMAIIEDLLTLIELNVTSHSQISSEFYDIFTLLLDITKKPSISDLIASRFDRFFAVINQGIDKNNEEALYTMIKFIQKAPNMCGEKICAILKGYLNETEIKNDEYSPKVAMYIKTIPTIVDKLHSSQQIVFISEIVPSILKTMLDLLNKNSNLLYQEAFLTLCEIMPFLKTAKNIKFVNFGKNLFTKIVENHESNDPHLMIVTSHVIAAMFDTFPNELQINYLGQTISLFMKDLSSEIILPEVYPTIFYTLSSIIRSTNLAILPFKDEIISKLDIFSLYRCPSFEMQRELLDAVLDTYAALFEVFQDDIVFLRKEENKVLMFLKKLQRSELCDGRILESSIKILFVIVCSFGKRSFAELRQDTVKQILQNGANYKENFVVSSTANKILNIVTNY